MKELTVQGKVDTVLKKLDMDMVYSSSCLYQESVAQKPYFLLRQMYKGNWEWILTTKREITYGVMINVDLVHIRRRRQHRGGQHLAPSLLLYLPLL